MSLVAVGAYLRKLREERGLSRADVIRRVDTNEGQIVRIEAGEVDTRASLFVALTRVLNCNLQHIQDLMLDESATAEDGRALAESWIADGQSQNITIPDDVADLAQTLAHNPLKMGQWIGFGKRLVEET